MLNQVVSNALTRPGRHDVVVRHVSGERGGQQPPSRQLGGDQILADLLRELDLPAGGHTGRSIECVLWSCPAVPSTMLSRGRGASGARAAGAQAQDRSGSVPRAAGRTRRSALDPHQRHRACPVRPEAQHADPRVTRPRGELGGTLRRDCCAASTSEALTLRGHGCAFLAPSTSVIEGSFGHCQLGLLLAELPHAQLPRIPVSP